MDIETIKQLISKVEKENEIFANKGSFDSLYYTPKKIIGREKEAEQLLKYIGGYKKNSIVPLISIHGRSGSGKTLLTTFLCNNLDDVHTCFVNLRQAKTIFGSSNLILTTLGGEPIKNSSGINFVTDKISSQIETNMKQHASKVFVLILDESDVIFSDKRGNPSDFIYKLVEMGESLRKKGILFCIITISNNVVSDYDLDDRVKSRIGTCEIHFSPYSKKDIREILLERVREGFAVKVDDDVIDYCALQSSLEHGDARRAIDLLKVSAEIASSKGEPLSIGHVDLASEKLQKDRIEEVMSSASYHSQMVLTAIAIRTYGKNVPRHTTTEIVNKYEKLVIKKTKPLQYRRVSELLKEHENAGLLSSDTSSKGRGGYNTKYRLEVNPETVLKVISPELWEEVKNTKKEHLEYKDHVSHNKRSKSNVSRLEQYLVELQEKYWE